MYMRQSAKLYRDERGMAAIVITMILMIVVSLIVLGFAQVARREQRQALDRQLVTQAFYAAESGINLAESRLRTDPTISKDDCPANDASGSPFTTADYTIDASTDTYITCLMVSDNVPSQVFQDVSTSSIVANVQTATAMNSIQFSWQAPASTAVTSCDGSAALPAAGSRSCSQPMIRVDLVPLGGSLSQAGLQNSQFTRFFSPNGTGGFATVGYAAGSMSNAAISTQCTTATTPYFCRTTINGLSGTRYGVRVQSYYGVADLDISTWQGSNRLPQINGQRIIDVTARATDVVRRLQARVSSSSQTIADFGVTSGGAGLCKRYALVSGGIATRTPAPGCETINTVSPAAMPNDDGAFTTGNGGGGDGSGGGGNGAGPFWNRNFNITLVPTNATVTGCVWNWGDGTNSGNLAPAKCTLGTVEPHVFPKIETCNRYTVQLVFHTSAGDVRTPSRQIVEPHGTSVSC